MHALILQQPHQLDLIECHEPVDKLGPHEALVQVHRAGVCGTDIHAYHGRQPFFTYPRTPGHELGVEVLKVGASVHGIEAGDHCAVEPYLNCGHCIACRRGRGNCCVAMQVVGVHIDGGFRERFVLPAAKLHRSPALSFDQLALVETLGIGAHAVQRAALETGEWALVIGAGPIGLSVIQFARQAGTNIIVLDTAPERLAFCSSHWGIEHTIRADEEALHKIQDLTNGDLPTAVFDATGNKSSMQSAFEYVAPGGRLVFVGLFPGEVTFNDPLFHRREMTLLATRNALPADFRNIIASLEQGEIDTTQWITHRAAIAEVPQRFADWATPGSGVLKAMIEF